MPAAAQSRRKTLPSNFSGTLDLLSYQRLGTPLACPPGPHQRRFTQRACQWHARREVRHKLVGHVSLGYDTWRLEHFFPFYNLDVRPAILIDLPAVEIRIAKRGEECFEDRVHSHIQKYEIRKKPEEKCELIHCAKLPDLGASRTKYCSSPD
jgi:hypothetical protein